MQLSILHSFCIPHTLRCRCQELQVLDDNRKALIPITIVRNGEVLREVYKPFVLCIDERVVNLGEEGFIFIKDNFLYAILRHLTQL